MAERLLRGDKTPPNSGVGFILFVSVILTAASAPAYAYIDPGSTTFFLQTVVGAFAAVIVVTKVYWRRAFGLLRRILGPKRR